MVLPLTALALQQIARLSDVYTASDKEFTSLAPHLTVWLQVQYKSASWQVLVGRKGQKNDRIHVL